MLAGKWVTLGAGHEFVGKKGFAVVRRILFGILTSFFESFLCFRLTFRSAVTRFGREIFSLRPQFTGAIELYRRIIYDKIPLKSCFIDTIDWKIR